LGQLDPKVEKAFQLLRAGHSHAEVAQLLGVSPRMIGRVIERAREFAAQQARVAVSPPPPPLNCASS
jgi:DNA-directed RNA polymerase specialized sigma24 family protein